MALNQIFTRSLAASDSPAANNSTATSTKKSASSLGIADFMKLLAAQMANQDPMNPTDNTEFISQMAQFSSLSAMQTLTTTAASQLSATNTLIGLNDLQYASSLIGKTVTVQYTKEDKTIGTDVGIVDSVNDDNKISINGYSYDLSSVTKVASSSDTTNSAYGASLVGKTVVVNVTDSDGKVITGSDGKATTLQGVVSSVNFLSTGNTLTIGGQNYPLSSVAKVVTSSSTTASA